MAGEDMDMRPGAFYWVLPANDPDTDQAWESEPHPARFSRYREDGVCLWHCLNVEGESDWPMKWVGPEIINR